MPGDYCPTQDYFNLQKTNENSRDRGFKTITNGEDLNDLLSPNIWDSSGNQLDAYLRNVAGLTQTANVESSYKSASNDYDDLKTGAYVILNESGYDNSSNKMQILNESMPILGSASSNQFNVKIADLPNSGNNPVTIIMKNYETISRNIKAEGSGAAAIAIHGRTRMQMYSGTADWDIIAEVKHAVNIPVIGNGDVTSGEDAVKLRD
ncbi:MAG: tRNA-dihydrouridine synthase, partial [Ruminococcus sp.]|nr:tRNA-dihydrouridine synthase [Ruminococcus sp.]